MRKIKCITFDKEAQDNLPQHIKDKMKADRQKASKNRKRFCKKYKNCDVSLHSCTEGCNYKCFK